MRVLIASLSTLILAAAGAPADAHAIILEASPAIGSTVHGGDVAIRLRFNSRLDYGRSRLILIRPDTSQLGLKIVASKEKPDTLTTGVKGLAPGHYRLRWQVLAIDGHITRGDIPFDVAP